MKRNFIILLAAWALLLNGSTLKAQSGSLIDSWQVGVNAIYDWQPQFGGIADFRQATNIGIGISLQHPVGFHSVINFSIAAPGLLKPVSGDDNTACYDRYYSAALSYRFYLNSNMFAVGGAKSGSLYFHAGIGGRLMYITTLTAQMPIGVGYAKWVTSATMLYAEVAAVPGIEVGNVFAGVPLFGSTFFAGYNLAVGAAFDF